MLEKNKERLLGDHDLTAPQTPTGFEEQGRVVSYRDIKYGTVWFRN